MAISYTQPDATLPLDQRYVRITGIVSGDKIDIETILGRPARQIEIIGHNSGDSIGVKYNTHRKLRKYNGEAIPNVTYVDSWLLNADTITYFGSDSHLSPERLSIKSVHVTGITYGSGGTSISILAW